jgi:acetoin utilization protein AcuB
MKKSSVWLGHPIRDFMTHAPQSITRGETLAVAHERMRLGGVRHLPVLDDDGKLVGVVSERDLYFAETLRGGDPSRVTVDVAMSDDAYAVTPETPLDEVAATMANHKYGCAVVFRERKVVGIFTTVDALRVLVDVLRHA